MHPAPSDPPTPHKTATQTRVSAPLEPVLVPVEGQLQRAYFTLRRWGRKHGKKLWWLHSLYALGLGAFVVAFAQKGFDHARWLSVSLGIAWLLVVLFFRVFGSGARQTNLEIAALKNRVRFYAMTYVLKNLYQGMLFFLLPFYYKSATVPSTNTVFLALLAICAMLSTLDIVFDRVLMKWRTVAAMFHGIILFGCLNLVIPALLPNTRTLSSLLTAAAITVLGFWTLHVDRQALRRKRNVLFLVLSVGLGMGTAYVARAGIPPVPMYLASSAVGPSILPDGRLTMEVSVIHASAVQELLAVTDVVIPGGKGERLHHVWRKDGVEVSRSTEDSAPLSGTAGVIRLRSSILRRDIPAMRVGRWAVDVETEDGQLVGRTSFLVVQ